MGTAFEVLDIDTNVKKNQKNNFAQIS